MIHTLLESVVLPFACGTAVLLSPRLPWCTDRGPRTTAWTGSLAVAVVALVALVMVEGASVLLLEEKWESLALSAAIVGCGGLLAQRDTRTLSLCAYVAVAIFILRMPGFDSTTMRLILAGSAAVASLYMTSVASRDAVRTPLALAISLASLAALLLNAGSLKVALVAGSLALFCAGASALAVVGRNFSAGAPMSIAALTLSLALSIYGCAYHAQGEAESWAFFLVWASPLAIALPVAGRSPRHANATLALVAIICAATIVHATLSTDEADPIDEVGETAPSYTSMNEKGTCDNRAFSDHHAVTV